jgi:hypothetical protein
VRLINGGYWVLAVVVMILTNAALQNIAFPGHPSWGNPQALSFDFRI